MNKTKSPSLRGGQRPTWQSSTVLDCFAALAITICLISFSAQAQTLTSPQPSSDKPAATTAPLPSLTATSEQAVHDQEIEQRIEQSSKFSEPAKTGVPLEITADKSLEWNRNKKLFIAHKNALAKQGDSSVKGETLTAHYRDGKNGGMEMYRLESETNVEVSSKDSIAYGQSADYEIDTGRAIMTGDNLKMISPDQIVTARDKFEYWTKEGKLVATGNARADRKNNKGETDTLQADVISAILADNTNGQRKLKTLEADGNVVIITPTERVTGTHGVYNAQTNRAVITGGVTIIRGPNTLQGDRAEVDMNTNTSQLFGGPSSTVQTGGQVKGIFYPGSDNRSSQ